MLIPEYQLSANLSGITEEPVSLYLAIAQLISKRGLDGWGGQNFYPRPMVYPKHPDFSAAISEFKTDDKPEITALIANSTDSVAAGTTIASAYDSEFRLLYKTAA